MTLDEAEAIVLGKRVKTKWGERLDCEGWADEKWDDGSFRGRFRGRVSFSANEEGEVTSEDHCLTCAGLSANQGGQTCRTEGDLRYLARRYNLPLREKQPTRYEQMRLF